MEHARRLSKVIFGATYRLEIFACLASGEVITLTGITERLGKPPSVSSVAKELQALETTGLLVREPSVPGMRSVYLRVSESPLWQVCRDLAEAAHLSQPTLRSAFERSS